MPELPEVQTIADGLNKKIVKARIVSVWSDWKKMIIFPKLWKEFSKTVVGKKIQKVVRRGKFIVFELSGGAFLVAHLRMTGHFLVVDKKKKNDFNNPINDKVNQYIHFKIFLEDGREVALSDLRKFAKIHLVTAKPSQCLFEKLGADPLDKKFTFKFFESVARGKRGNIKKFLMDQGIIAGIGNIYSSEILWEAGVSPLGQVEKMREGELREIFNAIKKVLKLAVNMRGDSESDYRDVDGKKGGYQKIQRVYQREGQKCHRDDGGIIKRVKIGQRSAFYCPKCQGENKR